MIHLKPKKTIVFVAICSLLIGFVVPFLMYNQVSNGQSFFELRMRDRIGIFIPTFFIFAAIRVLVILKTIEVDQDTWKVNYFFPKRKWVFSIADIDFIRKTNYVSYKYRIPITTYTIQLKNSKSMRISSNEISDFDNLVRILGKREYRELYKKKQ